MSKIQENREVRFILAVDKANDNLNQVAIEIAKNNHSKDGKQRFKFFLSELDNALKAMKNNCGSNVSDLFKDFSNYTYQPSQIYHLMIFLQHLILCYTSHRFLSIRCGNPGI